MMQLFLALGENGSTANKWIEAFIKDGKLSRIEQGKYRKIFLSGKFVF